MKRLFSALAALALLATAASAVRPTAANRSDARRFGLDRLHPAAPKTPSAAARAAFQSFNAAQGGSWRLRFNERTGLPESVVGGRDVPRPGRPDDAARAFLAAHVDMLGVDPNALSPERDVAGAGNHHLLYRQSYRGIPVEFAAVKVHLDARGSVVGVHSTYEPSIAVPTLPAVAADAAVRAAQADAGAGAALVGGAPSLVILPLQADGKNHLAWKMRVAAGRAGSFRYYVDAITGQVLFRYATQRFIGPCLTQGTVLGQVYDVDPSSTPARTRPFNNQYVYIGSGIQRVLTGFDVTYSSGFFCGQSYGKVAMSLQGPYVSVGQFRGPGAHYDNGAGTWQSLSTPVVSPHPYPANAVSVSTIDLTGAVPAGAVSFLPVFSDFHVGRFDGGSGEGSGDILQDDQLFVYDTYDNPIGAFIGDISPFNGPEVHGLRTHLAIRAKSGGSNSGYDIAVSSVLVLSSPDVDGGVSSSHTWTSNDASVSQSSSEVNLFYHLNLMHDYFASNVPGATASITKPVVAMADVGPNLLNAFYDPDYDALYFGDVSGTSPNDAFATDATVPHHEYVHYITERIWSIQNYGQAGAISEANADYFAASSLDDPAIGSGVHGFLGGGGPLRQVDCPSPSSSCNCPSDGPIPCYYSLGTPSTPWTGEIHSDSPFVSQALWDIRRAMIQRLGYAGGKSCVDNLQFQALLFFPESFGELYDALLQVDKMGIVGACGGANQVQSVITSAFSARGLVPFVADAYDANGGFESSVDISTLGAISAKLYPGGESDFFSFGAGPGLVQLTLSLPPSVTAPGFQNAYQLKLFNASRQQVAAAAPPYNGFGTLDGSCDLSDCTTTATQVTLRYNNPTGGLLYVQVVGGDSFNGSNSYVNSTTPYGLTLSFARAGALSGSVVRAKYDNDTIGFTVETSTFVSNQDWRFAYAQLRDQAYHVLPNTVTHVPKLATDYLVFVSSLSVYGTLTGQVQLVPGFGGRFPAAGTVFLEVFGYDVAGSTASMGLSNAINLSDNQAELTAYNNLFDPTKGQKATVKYGVTSAGHLTVKLYTVTGRYVATLVDGDVPAGKGSVDWDGHNSQGNVVASGIYVVRADGPGLRTTQKIAVVK